MLVSGKFLFEHAHMRDNGDDHRHTAHMHGRWLRGSPAALSHHLVVLCGFPPVQTIVLRHAQLIGNQWGRLLAVPSRTPEPKTAKYMAEVASYQQQ